MAAPGTPTPVPVPNRASTRDPFNNPNRYRQPQQNQARDEVRFVNGRPYREPPNVQGRNSMASNRLGHLLANF